jgi:hypothetical protein
MGKKKTLTSCKVSPILQQPVFTLLDFGLGSLYLSVSLLLKE